MFSSDFRRIGRRALSRNWGRAVLITLLATLLGASSGMGYSFTNSAAASSSSNTSGYWGINNPFFRNVLLPIFAAIALVSLAYSVIVFLFGGAVDLGLKRFNINLVEGAPQSAFSTLFSRFSIFGRALLLQLAMGLFIFLWTLLLVIPGVIAAYRYAMAPYLLANNPNLSVMEAIRLSKELMAGHKWRLFCLYFSFIGWFFLSVASFGVGFLFLNPYANAAEAAFFLNLYDPARLPENGAYKPPLAPDISMNDSNPLHY